MDLVDMEFRTGYSLKTSQLHPLYGNLYKTVNLQKLPSGDAILEVVHYKTSRGYMPFRAKYRTQNGTMPVRYVYATNLETIMATLFGQDGYIGVSDVLSEIADSINAYGTDNQEDLIPFSFSAECLTSRIIHTLDHMKFSRDALFTGKSPLEIKGYSGFTEYFQTGYIPSNFIHQELTKSPFPGFGYPDALKVSPQDMGVLIVEGTYGELAYVADLLENLFLTDMDLTYIVMQGKIKHRIIEYCIDRFRHIIRPHTEDDIRCDMIATYLTQTFIPSQHPDKDLLECIHKGLELRIIKTFNDEALIVLTAPDYKQEPFAIYYIDFIVHTFISQSIGFI
jgi:hypothetical protein